MIFKGQISPCGRIRARSFSGDIDFKRVKNNLQYFEGNLYPQGVGGGTAQGSGASGQWSVTARSSDYCSCFYCAAAEIDLAEVGHAVIMRCRIVIICKAGCGGVDAFGEA